MLRSNPPSRGETNSNRIMTGSMRNQIQLWEKRSVDESSESSLTEHKNSKIEMLSPNVVLRSTVR